MKGKHRYYCPNCEENFHSERVNMNERHHCGALSLLDWTYRGDDELGSSGSGKSEH